MAVTIKIPTPLRNLTGGARDVAAEAGTVGELIDQLEGKHPGIRDRICDETGEVRRFVNIYVDGEDIRFVDGLATPVRDGGDVSIVPAVAGGDR
ncbi:MAG: MoaD/ThiS family protein [Dehalococcoidales bacterium]|nr:MoaD/ThiS family protein [Dehalococcoidales bacterium]